MEIIVVVMDALFLSTLSLRRATTLIWDVIAEMTISIHALLAESDQAKTFKVAAHRISIHALLAESDSGHEQAPYRVEISIHALLAESDRHWTYQQDG